MSVSPAASAVVAVGKDEVGHESKGHQRQDQVFPIAALLKLPGLDSPASSAVVGDLATAATTTILTQWRCPWRSVGSIHPLLQEVARLQRRPATWRLSDNRTRVRPEDCKAGEFCQSCCDCQGCVKVTPAINIMAVVSALPSHCQS